MNRFARGGRASLLVAGLVALVTVTIPARAEAPFGMNTRPVLQGLNFPDLPPSSGAIKIERVFSNISFGGDYLVYLAAAPGDDSNIYVVTKSGNIWYFPNSPSADDSSKKRLLDITAKTINEAEEGLLGFAFDPGFASNKTFYVYYAIANGEHRTRLSKFTQSATVKLTGLTEKVLWEMPQDTKFHKAGCLQIGPDGKLWLSIGDGSGGGDPGNFSQSLGRPNGKILRFNLDGSVPADNPFVGTPGALGYVWASGFRNPWRYSFDRTTGELWVGDVGQETVEEVDVVRKGGNYGWRVYEGDAPYKNPNNLPAGSFDAPLFTYRHDGTGLVPGSSVTGGYVYRGSEMPNLAGQYVFGDFMSGNVYALTRSGSQFGSIRTIGSVPALSSFGEDNAGNLYAVSLFGKIFRIQPEDQGGSVNFPAKLSQTGLFTNLAQLTPTQGLIEYEINAPFWSDGALKRRWVGVPGTGRIGFSTQDAWSWPAMSVVVKHFEMQMADGTVKRLETRVLLNQRPGWRGYTYRWNTAGTDATLIDAAQTVTLNVIDPSSPTGARTQTYEFPGRGACLTCHNQAHGEVLGLRTSQVNRLHQFPSGVTDNQLRAWNHIGMFDSDIGDTKYYYALPAVTDSSKGQAARARAYFDVNCSQCHSPGGPTPVDMDFRVYSPISWTKTVNIAPSSGDLGIADARRIAAGSKERSIVWQRMNSTAGARMPPIASHVIDKDAVALIGAWIDAGAPDSPDQPTLRPMHGGSFWGSRTGVGRDTLGWNFPKAQGCTLKVYNAANKNGKVLGNFGPSDTFSQGGQATKDDYWLGCWNPYGTDWWEVLLK